MSLVLRKKLIWVENIGMLYGSWLLEVKQLGSLDGITFVIYNEQVKITHVLVLVADWIEELNFGVLFSPVLFQCNKIYCYKKK